MKDYRWPGYAIQFGKLYETAGLNDDGVQLWRAISWSDRIHPSVLRGLARHLTRGGVISGWPSDGVILEGPP